MKFCETCGSKISADAAYCGTCGSKVAEPESNGTHTSDAVSLLEDANQIVTRRLFRRSESDFVVIGGIEFGNLYRNFVLSGGDLICGEGRLARAANSTFWQEIIADFGTAESVHLTFDQPTNAEGDPKIRMWQFSEHETAAQSMNQEIRNSIADGWFEVPDQNELDIFESALEPEAFAPRDSSERQFGLVNPDLLWDLLTDGETRIWLEQYSPGRDFGRSQFDKIGVIKCQYRPRVEDENQTVTVARFFDCETCQEESDPVECLACGGTGSEVEWSQGVVVTLIHSVMPQLFV